VSSPNDIPCRDIVELVTEYFERTLSPEERARVEQHLVICPPCVRYLDQMRETSRLLGTAHPPASPEEKKKLLSIFREWKSRGAGA
jgi:hypothetical protein